MTDFKIIFVHGYESSSRQNWFPQIALKLIQLGIDFEIPDFPGQFSPEASQWLQVLHHSISKNLQKKKIILVGHSLGTRAILLYLEKYDFHCPLVVLIGSLANRTENRKRREGHLSTFFEDKIDISKVKQKADKFVLIHSIDDDHVPIEQAEELSKDLNVKLEVYKDHKHFTEPQDALIILDVLRRELGF